MACENFQASVDALEQKKAELQADLVDFGPTANKNILKKIRAQLIQTNSSLAAAQQQLADCLNSITQPSQPCDGIQAQVDELEQQQVGIRGDLADLGPNGNLITIRKLQTELAQTNIALAASQKQLFDCLNPLPPLPPGELRDKVISLAYLQSKCDVFFNQRAHPLL